MCESELKTDVREEREEKKKKKNRAIKKIDSSDFTVRVTLLEGWSVEEQERQLDASVYQLRLSETLSRLQRAILIYINIYIYFISSDQPKPRASPFRSRYFHQLVAFFFFFFFFSEEHLARFLSPSFFLQSCLSRPRSAVHMSAEHARTLSFVNTGGNVGKLNAESSSKTARASRSR